jgi:hypothetical protein
MGVGVHLVVRLYIPSFLVDAVHVNGKAREERDVDFGVCALHRRGRPASVARGG